MDDDKKEEVTPVEEVQEVEQPDSSDGEKSESTVGKIRKVVAAVTATKIVFSVMTIALPLLIVLVVFFGAIAANNEDFDGDEIPGGGTSYNPYQLRCSENGFAICYTSFSKEGFKEKVSEYAKSHPNWQVFADYSDDYYDYASSVQVNPELVLTVAYKENGGNITAGSYNYWGYGCSNTGGNADCESYDTFMEGAKKLIDNASNWNSLFEWFSVGKYSYIGDYWYNPGGSGLGGCYYAPYIYSSMPNRVKNACASGKECSDSSCVKTTQEDQDAYANYLVGVMAYFRKEVFGLESNEGGINPEFNPEVDDADVATIISWDQKTAWKYLIGFESEDRHPSVQKSTMDNRVVDIEVPMRKWKSGNGINTITDTEKVMQKITVNKAIASLWKAFFEDVYENAPDFVIGSFDGCYNYRNITDGESLSPHAYGVACDINANTSGNGYYEKSYSSEKWEQLPETRSKYQIVYQGSRVVQIAHKYTLINGSDWSDPHDAMHFSFTSDWYRDKAISCQGKTYCG